MKIAVLGAGAMGSLIGGYLSSINEVYLIDIDNKITEKINSDGICIREPEGEHMVFPKALTNSSTLSKMDLVIVFVKAMYSRVAMKDNMNLVGKSTYVMTMQNGSGHEDILKEFIPEDQIIIGTTQHNSSIIEPGYINHGGYGPSNIGALSGNNDGLEKIAKNFTESGIECYVSPNIKELIWNKLFINVSASVLTAILRVNLGYMVDNAHGRFLKERLVREAVEVANMDGMEFDADAVILEVDRLLENSRKGYTSIYMDMISGNKTEVDTINGAVIKAAKRNGASAPTHEFVVELVHAMEDIIKGDMKK